MQDDYDDFVEKVVKRLMLRVFQAVSVATPVDTGFARAGWSMSTGAPQPGPALGPLAGPGIRAELKAAQRQLAASLQSANEQKANAVIGAYKLSAGPIFIVNNVRYIVFLNDGTSDQAPELFIDTAVAGAVRATSRELS